MTIASEANRSGPYACNGATTHFPFGFKIYDAAHIRVILTAPDGTESILALVSDYAVAGVGESGGGAVDTVVAYGAGYRITLVLNVPFTQNVDLENQGAYFAETIERAIDLQTQMSLQLKEQVARSVVLPVTSSVSVDKLTGAVLSLADVQPQLTALAPIAEDIKAVAGISTAVVSAEGNANTAVAAAALASGKAADAAASAEAAKTWDPAVYSTTAQVAAMLDGYVPTARRLIAGTGVKLNGGAEASLTEDVTIMVAGVPTGAVMGFDLAAPPVGWIVGDGAAINRHVYADLDAVKYCGDAQNATATAWYRCTNPTSPGTTRSVTGDYLVTRDLRGVFIRFLDGGRGLDSGRVLGSQQADAIRNILGGLYDAYGGLGSGSGAIYSWATSDYIKSVSGGGTTGVSQWAFDASRVVPTAAENRPVNVALLGCIKY